MQIMKRSNFNKPFQRGSALIISLILLVVMTLLAIASMRVTTMQEKMSGNMRDSDLAFQSAEAALRAGEVYLQGATVGPFNGTSGLFHYANNPAPDWTVAATWTGSVRTYGSTLPHVASAPLFFIEELVPVPEAGSSLEAGVAIEESGMYRITARGVGGTDTAVSVLQSTYKR